MKTSDRTMCNEMTKLLTRKVAQMKECWHERHDIRMTISDIILSEQESEI